MLGDTAEVIGREAAATDDLLSRLADQVSATTGTWEGVASEGFQRTYATWMSAARDLHRQWTFIHSVVVAAHNNHAVHKSAAMWRV